MELPSESCSDGLEEGCPVLWKFNPDDTLSRVLLASSSVAVVPMSASRSFVPSVSEIHTEVTSSRPMDCRTYLEVGVTSFVCVSGMMMREQKSWVRVRVRVRVRVKVRVKVRVRVRVIGL